MAKERLFSLTRFIAQANAVKRKMQVSATLQGCGVATHSATAAAAAAGPAALGVRLRSPPL